MPKKSGTLHDVPTINIFVRVWLPKIYKGSYGIWLDQSKIMMLSGENFRVLLEIRKLIKINA